jgi:hypothetical protein
VGEVHVAAAVDQVGRVLDTSSDELDGLRQNVPGPVVTIIGRAFAPSLSSPRHEITTERRPA